jgi:hypothetical protein
MLDPEWSLQKSLWTFFLPGQSYSGMLISQLSLCLSLGGSLLPETSRDSGWAEAGSEDQGSRPFIVGPALTIYLSSTHPRSHAG